MDNTIMDRKAKIIIIILILSSIYLVNTLTLFIHLNPEIQIYPPISEIKNPTSLVYEEKYLGSTDFGTVTRKGPYGNTNNPQKIAIIIGVHPQESNAHQAIQKALEDKNSTLNFAYYLYIVNVTQDVADYTLGRNHGEELANLFVVPDILHENFKLAIDIHSNAGHYDKKWFLYIPLEDDKTYQIVKQLLIELTWLELYQPPNPTSTKYVTIPLIQEGTPSFVYETYSYEDYTQTQNQAYQFLEAVDKLKL